MQTSLKPEKMKSKKEKRNFAEFSEIKGKKYNKPKRHQKDNFEQWM